MFASRRSSFGVVGGQQVFKHTPQQFGVQCHLLQNGGVFGDGEFITLKNGNKPGHFGRLEFVVTIGIAQINRAHRAKKQIIGQTQWVVVTV